MSEKKRGRPKSAPPGSTVCAWLPVDDHDRLVRLASESRKSVSAFVRSLIKTSIRRADTLRDLPTSRAIH
jgi:hypothetical protein